MSISIWSLFSAKFHTGTAMFTEAVHLNQSTALASTGFGVKLRARLFVSVVFI